MGMSVNFLSQFSLPYSYLNIFEEADMKIERDFFKKNPNRGTFYNRLIVGTVIPPPQDKLSLVKVSKFLISSTKVMSQGQTIT